MGEGGQRHLILIDVDYRVARQQWAVGPEPDPPVAVAVDPPSGDVFWRYHVNNDLAFMIEDMGARYLYPDHKHVDDVLAFRTRPVVYPEIQRDLCPSLFTETVPATADRDIYAWRQLAWENALRLQSAPTQKARDAIAREIRRHAKDKAHEILRWNR